METLSLFLFFSLSPLLLSMYIQKTNSFVDELKNWRNRSSVTRACFPKNLYAFFSFLFRCSKPQITWFFIHLFTYFSLDFFSFFKDYNKKHQRSHLSFILSFFLSFILSFFLLFRSFFCALIFLSLKITTKQQISHLTFFLSCLLSFF